MSSQLERDIAAWVEGHSRSVPDFWDDLSITERLAAYLAALGYTRLHLFCPLCGALERGHCLEALFGPDTCEWGARR